MPQSLAQLYVHLIFSTKNREPVSDDSIRVRLHEYLGGTLRDLGCKPIEINSMPDHVHLLFSLSRTVTVSDVVAQLKRGSSLWVKELSAKHHAFHWQNGYGAFSVSGSKVEVVQKYIRNQEVHHRKETYQDEMRRWLMEYGIEYDERHLWD